MKRNPATVHSLAALSLITNVYIICLDIIAVIYWTLHGESELRDLFHKIEMERTLGPLVFVFIVDAAMLILGAILLLITIVCMYKYDKKNCESQCTCENRFSVSSRGTCHCKACVPNVNGSEKPKCKHCVDCTTCRYDYLSTLSLTVFSAIVCIIAHSPYIAIAYLDDGYHASSMFIYYSILGYAIFGLLWLFFHRCEHFESDNIIQLLTDRDPKVKCNITVTCTLVSLCFVIIIFLGFVATITCYFVLIPINKSISNAPNRVVSIYQSGGFVVGSVIVYKILEFFYIKKKKEATLEDIYKILKEKQDFRKLQQQYNQLQMELLLSLQSPESQDQLRGLHEKFYTQRLENLHKIEQRLLQQQQQDQAKKRADHGQKDQPSSDVCAQGQSVAGHEEIELQVLSAQPQAPTGQPGAGSNGTRSPTLDDLQREVFDLQQRCYEILFPPPQTQQTNKESDSSPQTIQQANKESDNSETGLDCNQGEEH